jgi:hypothetical protein
MPVLPTRCGEQGPLRPEFLWGAVGPPQQGLGRLVVCGGGAVVGAVSKVQGHRWG